MQGHASCILWDLDIYALQNRYKREAYRGSEFAPRIMADNGLRVVMKVLRILLLLYTLLNSVLHLRVIIQVNGIFIVDLSTY